MQENYGTSLHAYFAVLKLLQTLLSQLQQLGEGCPMPQIIRNITEITRCRIQYRTDKFAPLGLKACRGSYLQEICANSGISQEQLAKSICINKSNVARQAAAFSGKFPISFSQKIW